MLCHPVISHFLLTPLSSGFLLLLHKIALFKVTNDFHVVRSQGQLKLSPHPALDPPPAFSSVDPSFPAGNIFTWLPGEPILQVFFRLP